MSFCQHSFNVPQSPWGKADELAFKHDVKYEDDELTSSEDEGRLFVDLEAEDREGNNSYHIQPSSKGDGVSRSSGSEEDMESEESSNGRVSPDSGESCSSDAAKRPCPLNEDLCPGGVMVPVVHNPPQCVVGHLERTPVSDSKHKEIITPAHMDDCSERSAVSEASPIDTSLYRVKNDLSTSEHIISESSDRVCILIPPHLDSPECIMTVNYPLSSARALGPQNRMGWSVSIKKDLFPKEIWTEEFQSNLDDTPVPLPKPRKVRSYWHSNVELLNRYQQRLRQAGGSGLKPVLTVEQQREARRKELHKRTQWAFFRAFNTVRPVKTEEEGVEKNTTRQE